jgi:hypothetical protein
MPALALPRDEAVLVPCSAAVRLMCVVPQHAEAMLTR